MPFYLLRLNPVTESVFRKFVLQILLLAAAMAVAGALVWGLVLPRLYSPVMPFLLLFFFLFTILTFYWLLRTDDFKRFAQAAMIVTFLRLIVYAAITVLCLAFSRAHPVSLVIWIGLVYIVFSFWETHTLSKVVRQLKKLQKSEEIKTPPPDVSA